MMPATIRKQITIHAPAAHVWQFVGTEAGLRQWWQTEITLEARQGGRCSERGLINGKPYHFEGIVAVYDPPRQLVLLLAGAEKGATWPTSMNITMTLEEVAGVTTVRVVHGVADVLPAPAVPRPIQQPPTILNQWPQPGQPVGGTLTPSTPIRPALADDGLIQQYAAWWSGRLIGLLHLVQREKTG
jgi:uncharacterized protein YndB with AHSA1/START domain